MIIYNTTFSVPKELQNEFLDFVCNHLIPEAIGNGAIKEPRLSRVFSKEDHGSYSYALEFKTDTIEELEAWNETDGKKFHSMISTKFGQNVPGFATLMQTIDL